MQKLGAKAAQCLHSAIIDAGFMDYIFFTEDLLAEQIWQMKTLAVILFFWQFSVFSSTSNIIFLFVKGRVIVYPRYLPLRAEVKITDIEDTLKWKQVEKSSF